MKISIITPSFNQANYLEQTIDSVLSQNYSNLEYIIIDGGSTDGSVDIIKKHEKYLTYWESQPDNGQSHAINKGVQRATGEIINWINSDDFYDPNTFKFLNEIFQDQKINCVCCQSRIIQGNRTIRISRGTDVYQKNIAKTLGWARFDQPETFFRKESWGKVGYLNTDLHFLMDREWWMRYLLIFGLEGIFETDNILVNFRLHDTSKTQTQKTKFQLDHDSFFYSLASQVDFEEAKTCIEKVTEINKRYIFPLSDDISGEFIKKVINYYLLKRANEFYASSQVKKCKHLLRIINTKYFKPQDRKLFSRLRFRNQFVPVFLRSKINEI